MAQLFSRGDVKFGEHLAEVPFDGAGADEHLGADLGVREIVAGQPGDLRLLCGELPECLGCPSANCLASGEQFAAGTLGKSFCPDAAERVMGKVKLLAGFQAPVRATQPFAVQELSTGEVDGDPGPGEALDRLSVERVGGFAIAQGRTGAGLDSERPLRPGGACSFLQSPQGCRADVRSIAARSRLDQLGQAPAKETQVIMFTDPLRGGE